jgi:hypothetical protein
VVLVGLIHHRHHPDPPPPVLLCNIEAKAESNSPRNWHVACSHRLLKSLAVEKGGERSKAGKPSHEA